MVELFRGNSGILRKIAIAAVGLLSFREVFGLEVLRWLSGSAWIHSTQPKWLFECALSEGAGSAGLTEQGLTAELGQLILKAVDQQRAGGGWLGKGSEAEGQH